MDSWTIRRFGGTLADAHGILAVEQQTFHECPYPPEELRERLSRPEQRPWLAEVDGRIVGFLAGLQTCGWRGPQLEADLLAVEPAWQRRGIATALLLALRRDAPGAYMLRGAVNLHNPASSGAFSRAGFQPSARTYDLMLYRIRGRVPRPLPAWGGDIHPLRDAQEAEQVAALDRDLPSADHLWRASHEPRTTVLVATAAGAPVGAAELLEVHTVLYSGLWLETLLTSPGTQRACGPLIAAAVEIAKERALDEVGCLVPQQSWPSRSALLQEGFAPLDTYRTWTARPLGMDALG